MSRSSIFWPVSLEINHYILSYSIVHAEQSVMPKKALLEALTRINREVRQLVWTGWSMFYPFTRSEIAPQVLPENPDGSGTYFLETNLVSDNRIADTTLPDFWRVSPNGWATLVRAYREDRSRDEDGKFDPDRKPGTWLSPETPIRETAELVRHAYLFSKYFSSSTAIEFDCQWKGLKDRELKDFDPGVYWSPGRVSRSDIRKATGIWPISELLDNWPNVVAALSCPVLEIFGLDFCSTDFVREMESRFRKLPQVMTNSDASGEFAALQYPVLTLFYIWLQSFTTAQPVTFHRSA